jgi:hypothetical protein
LPFIKFYVILSPQLEIATGKGNSMPCALITWALISPATCGRGHMRYIKNAA